MLSCVAALCVFIYHTNIGGLSENIVNVYGWYGIVPRSVIKDFEKETGIKVRYDIYDNNDMLEAKLLATNSGYDVVVPSFLPYAARQVSLSVYQKMDVSKIPNIKNIIVEVDEKIQDSNGNGRYLMPFYWGTNGIAINKDVVSKILPNIDFNSYDLVLKAENLSKLSSHGVSFPEECVDIFPQTMLYLNKDPNTKNISDIKDFKNHFKKLRKYITKFSSTMIVNDLLTGDICVGIGQSDNVYKAMRMSKNIGKKIEYILPDEGGTMWIDCLAIPVSCKHFDNAHKFINYVLRPDVAAKISEYSGILVAVNGSLKNRKKEVEKYPFVFPKPDKIKKLIVSTPSRSEKDLEFDRQSTRAWSQIRLGNFNDEAITNGGAN